MKQQKRKISVTYANRLFSKSKLVYSDLHSTGFDLTDKMKGFTVPTLILHGRDDIVNPDTASKTHDILPDSRLLILDSGHYGWLEQPEEYFSSINEFLKPA